MRSDFQHGLKKWNAGCGKIAKSNSEIIYENQWNNIGIIDWPEKQIVFRPWEQPNKTEIGEVNFLTLNPWAIFSQNWTHINFKTGNLKELSFINFFLGEMWE